MLRSIAMMDIPVKDSDLVNVILAELLPAARAHRYDADGDIGVRVLP